MPSLIHYEGWDGVSAPSIPSGWTVSSPLVTAGAPYPSGISPLTSPNWLKCSSSGTNTHYPATWDVADPANGNVLVYASFIAYTTTNNQTFGVFARGSAYPLFIGSSSYYWAQLSPENSVCQLYAVVGGTQTSIGSVSLGTALSDQAWYQLQLNCQGSTIAVVVVRASDGYYLNSSGSFQSGSAVAITATDTSVTGSGYAGLTLQSHSDGSYTDEWFFYAYIGSPQPALIRAQPIIQRARGRGRVIQPLAVRFGTPALPLALWSHGITWRDPSRQRTSIDHGRVWLPVPARMAPPASIPFAFWTTVKRLDQSELRRRLAPGRAATPPSFARLGPPPVTHASNWRTIRWIDPSAIRRRAAPGHVWLPRPLPLPGSANLGGWTQQYITSVNPPVQYGTELFLSWTSDAPPGLVFQVYENDVLVWSGSSPYCTLPLPPYIVRFDIGTVGFTQQYVSFASLLPAAPLLQAELNWLGGTFEATDIAGFHVYGENSPGGGIDYSSILATIPAYTAGIITDGFGYGGFGQGGFGEAAGSYSWVSDALTSGTWNFAVVPFDTNGNEGTGATTAVTIIAPPQEPAPFSDRLRLHYTYNASLYEVTLNWNASPG